MAKPNHNRNFANTILLLFVEIDHYLQLIQKEGTGGTGTASISPPIGKCPIRTQCSLFGER